MIEKLSIFLLTILNMQSEDPAVSWSSFSHNWKGDLTWPCVPIFNVKLLEEPARASICMVRSFDGARGLKSVSALIFVRIVHRANVV